MMVFFFYSTEVTGLIVGLVCTMSSIVTIIFVPSLNLLHLSKY